MRIGVKKTIHENLLEIGAEKFLGQGGPVEFHSGQRMKICNFFAMDILHRQDPGRAVVQNWRGHDDVFEFP